MILELDLGNTRAKWRIVDAGGKTASQGSSDIGDWLDGQFPDVWRRGLERARIASVLAETTEGALITKLRSELSLSAELARSAASCAGVTNSYAEAARLGVDRWLAMIAAYRLSADAVMVVDVGTALKVDVVDDAGSHIGGYIIPGSKLMERALFEGTDRVRYDEGRPLDSVILGRDTRACVQHGIAAALVGAVIVAIDQCRLALGKQPRLCLTGGAGEQLRVRLLELGIADVRYEADLVMDGLRWVLA